jgi:hypothetical protein
MAAFERHLADELDSQLEASPPGGITDLLGDIRNAARRHRAILTDYLGKSGETAPAEVVVPIQRLSGDSVTERLRWNSVTLAYGASGYAVLQELALKQYDPRLRDIVPKHLKTHLAFSFAVAQLLPQVTAQMLASEGLHCACICPMCGLGACGCVALGRQSIETAWREALVAVPAVAGFAVPPPRPGSPLAALGVRGGDLLLAVDDTEVRTIPEIQAAIRKHPLGDEVRLRFRRDDEPARDVRVQHTSDYPKTS